MLAFYIVDKDLVCYSNYISTCWSANEVNIENERFSVVFSCFQKTFNLEISCCHLAHYVNEMNLSAASHATQLFFLIQPAT